jgi:hypothetical protein
LPGHWRGTPPDERDDWIFHLLRREAEVAACGRKIDSAPAAKESAENALKKWLTDPDLAGLREPDLLEKLPSSERQACRELWQDIRVQIERARRRN